MKFKLKSTKKAMYADKVIVSNHTKIRYLLRSNGEHYYRAYKYQDDATTIVQIQGVLSEAIIKQHLDSGKYYILTNKP